MLPRRGARRRPSACRAAREAGVEAGTATPTNPWHLAHAWLAPGCYLATRWLLAASNWFCCAGTTGGWYDGKGVWCRCLSSLACVYAAAASIAKRRHSDHGLLLDAHSQVRAHTAHLRTCAALDRARHTHVELTATAARARTDTQCAARHAHQQGPQESAAWAPPTTAWCVRVRAWGTAMHHRVARRAVRRVWAGPPAVRGSHAAPLSPCAMRLTSGRVRVSAGRVTCLFAPPLYRERDARRCAAVGRR